MKTIAALILGLTFAFVSWAGAESNIAGILETNATSTQVDSALWYLSMGPTWEIITDWGGPPGVTDTYQFEVKNEWPSGTILFYRIESLPFSQYIEPVEPDTWYELSGAPTQGPRVMFKDTILLGIRESGRVSGSRPFAISPNPVLSGLANINCPDSGTRIALKIYDISGREVLDRQIVAVPAGITLDLSSLKSGIYLMRIEGSGFALNRKLLLLLN
ncbi:MAG: T9SS type A sorting domain-containing protein [bacterium]